MPISSSPSEPTSNVRRFACTSCGMCCNRGPEMELGEATSLADTFILSLMFKAHSLPLDERSEYAKRWWQGHGSRIPVRPALEEQQRHLSQLASRRQTEKRRERQILLTISATVWDDGRGRCPALEGDRCGIYEVRPLTCRTVPMHYSRPPSTLRSYLDRFTSTPGYRCDTGQDAPIILDGNRVIDPAVREYRDDAMTLAKADREWKRAMLAVMDEEERASAAELPTYAAILENTDRGYATALPMIVGWRVAERNGLISRDRLNQVCRDQISLIKAEIGKNPVEEQLRDLRDILVVYELELTRYRRELGTLLFVDPDIDPFR